MKIIVVGAGAFGGWIALMLQRKGHQVQLLDGHGPANARASSGDESRVIRALYKDEIYTRMTLQSMQLWEENEILFGEKYFYRTGVFNFIGRDESRWLAAKSHLNKWHVGYEELDNAALISRFPMLSTKGIQYSVLEEGGGYLRARAGCEAVVKQFVLEGGQYLQKNVKALQQLPTTLSEIELEDGSNLEADAFVFAAGPWLSQILPQVLEGVIRPSKQDLFYFGLPSHFTFKQHIPVWCDFATLEEDVMYYGIPAIDQATAGFGFKVGKDVAGPDFDPEHGERIIDLKNLENARHFMEQRFPFMKRAPLVQARVCQYENTLDAHLIIDTIPGLENVWVAGGGSGHGYKLGAAVGHYLANRIEGSLAEEPLFLLNRLSKPLDGDQRR
ncbi:MAG: FAD-dependent oxidoreductase [Saprospiraceae bacterium]|nr:FAD-dependent oxidoreductase [Saprospiraceae bacterium]